MKKILTLALMLAAAVPVLAGEPPVKLDTKKLTEVPNAVLLEENLIAGGAPGAKGLGQAAEQGVRTVIDLRNPEEGTSEEKDHAEAVGLKYVNIPVSVENFSPRQAEQLSEVLKDPATGPVLLHCATGQRAAAVWALHRNLHEGVPAEQALSDAQAKGLKKPALIEKLKTLLKA